MESITKQLVNIGHGMSKEIAADEPAVAKLLVELSSSLDVQYERGNALEAKCAALAAENGQMLRLLTDISENHDEYVNQDEYLYAGIPMDYVSEINAYVSRDVEAENPFKETDAFLAEVRAQGVESAGEYLKQYAQGLHEEARLVLQDAGELCNGFAAQLRQEAAQ